MDFDRFEVIVDPAAYFRWPEGTGYQPAEIRINGRPLLELVRAAEEPWDAADRREEVAAGEDPSDVPSLAGNYLYLPASLVLLPARNLLDQPYDTGFELEADDPRRGKATLLGCTCSVIECWFLQVRIELGDGWVSWSDFGQFHRDWQLDLGPFVFERRRYEAALRGPG